MGKQLADSRLETCIFFCRKLWTKPGLIAKLTTFLFDIFRKFYDIENNMLKKQTAIIVKCQKLGYGGQPCVIILSIIKTNKCVNKEK